MMRTATLTLLTLGALALVAVAAPAQADLIGTLENKVGGPIPPHEGCNDYDSLQLRVCVFASPDCVGVGFNQPWIGQGNEHVGC